MKNDTYKGAIKADLNTIVIDEAFNDFKDKILNFLGSKNLYLKKKRITVPVSNYKKPYPSIHNYIKKENKFYYLEEIKQASRIKKEQYNVTFICLEYDLDNNSNHDVISNLSWKNCILFLISSFFQETFNNMFSKYDNFSSNFYFFDTPSESYINKKNEEIIKHEVLKLNVENPSSENEFIFSLSQQSFSYLSEEQNKIITDSETFDNLNSVSFNDVTNLTKRDNRFVSNDFIYPFHVYTNKNRDNKEIVKETKSWVYISFFKKLKSVLKSVNIKYHFKQFKHSDILNIDSTELNSDINTIYIVDNLERGINTDFKNKLQAENQTLNFKYISISEFRELYNEKKSKNFLFLSDANSFDLKDKNGKSIEINSKKMLGLDNLDFIDNLDIYTDMKFNNLLFKKNSNHTFQNILFHKNKLVYNSNVFRKTFIDIYLKDIISNTKAICDFDFKDSSFDLFMVVNSNDKIDFKKYLKVTFTITDKLLKAKDFLLFDDITSLDTDLANQVLSLNEGDIVLYDNINSTFLSFKKSKESIISDISENYNCSFEDFFIRNERSMNNNILPYYSYNKKTNAKSSYLYIENLNNSINIFVPLLKAVNSSYAKQRLLINIKSNNNNLVNSDIFKFYIKGFNNDLINLGDNSRSTIFEKIANLFIYN